MRKFLYQCFAVLLLTLVVQGAAISHAQTIAQMYHRSWLKRDGAPDSIWQMSQSSDGFLWIASDAGLYRFDGLQFKKYAASTHHLLSNQITAVYGATNGDVWVGYQFGGCSRIRGLSVTNYSGSEVVQGTVLGFAEDADKRLWIGAQEA
jgi:ligand-binding sensor domain-containing protein